MQFGIYDSENCFVVLSDHIPDNSHFLVSFIFSKIELFIQQPDTYLHMFVIPIIFARKRL